MAGQAIFTQAEKFSAHVTSFPEPKSDNQVERSRRVGAELPCRFSGQDETISGHGEEVTGSIASISGRAETPGTDDRVVIVTGLASDAHTWNLIFMQLLMEELGCVPVNLGPCVPDEVIISNCLVHFPALVVISSVNGHGYRDGMRVIENLRRCKELAGTAVVIGGKLGITGTESVQHIRNLMEAGFDGVFEGAKSVASFRNFFATLGKRAVA